VPIGRTDNDVPVATPLEQIDEADAAGWLDKFHQA
jgi:hypothetical protein